MGQKADSQMDEGWQTVPHVKEKKQKQETAKGRSVQVGQKTEPPTANSGQGKRAINHKVTNRDWG
ncbi:hypothetical protein PC129_g18816 [Phytophthora cactorum]|uniref:Uncharacterized protein n=1 Tax=Phytophthora cactorum TaxID=29920 RepID=A0A329S9Q6_9STRA|nr:hypothetical protein Pcac1_g12383 [Phytophthora cactorum]KAG2801580.1 hypothetical protein PC112_g19981 [Phytophthora cactorum]KAG2838003.1 hypothetical protein PC111_g4427 [Phytophthora cactorum]KAG2883090.1 hypothetical protein PC114_g20733 [Phytophthora cactorum]KAG2890615.1 hypothetical protein PC115_g19453 [Phytophthora cactorum]